MPRKKTKEKIRQEQAPKKYFSWWLAAGLFAYFATAIYGIVSTIPVLNFTDAILVSIDWLASSIIYFFFGATLGHLFEIVKYRKKETWPVWLILLLTLWAVSSVSLFFFANRELISPALISLFPLAYGIFFPSVAYTMLVPKNLETNVLVKTLFNMALLVAGYLWLALPQKKQLAKHILLFALFAVLFLGFVGCAVTLSQ